MGTKSRTLQKVRQGADLCRHCHKLPINRPRGLCWSCYYKPDVRTMYPSHAVHGQNGIHNDTRMADRGLPPTPTEAPPGSEAKIRVMIERAAARQTLDHPQDEPMDRDSRRRK